MKQEDILMAYIAGLIDGDGSISIIKENRSSGTKYYPCIQLSNVFEGMIDLLHMCFGGCKKIKSVQNHSKKIQFVWNVRGFDSCKHTIEKIYPYLVLKKNQAKNLIEFINDSNDAEKKHMKMKSLNNDCLVDEGKVVKQARKNTEDLFFWSYFAGILDTEGSFSIRRNKPSCGSICFKYNPMIQLGMASFAAMNYIRSNLCFGKVCFPKAKTTQRGFIYKMAIGKIDECIETINKIIPFLKFKTASAKELLNFCKNYTPIIHKQKGVPIEELEFRENCYQRLKQVNESGIVKPSLIDSETLKLGDEGQV